MEIRRKQHHSKVRRDQEEEGGKAAPRMDRGRNAAPKKACVPSFRVVQVVLLPSSSFLGGASFLLSFFELVLLSFWVVLLSPLLHWSGADLHSPSLVWWALPVVVLVLFHVLLPLGRSRLCQLLGLPFSFPPRASAVLGHAADCVGYCGALLFVPSLLLDGTLPFCGDASHLALPMEKTSISRVTSTWWCLPFFL